MYVIAAAHAAGVGMMLVATLRVRRRKIDLQYGHPQLMSCQRTNRVADAQGLFYTPAGCIRYEHSSACVTRGRVRANLHPMLARVRGRAGRD